MTTRQLLQYLGKLGTDLPLLTEAEWTNIFRFLEYFFIVDFDIKDKQTPNVHWNKILDILYILGKIKQ